MMPFQMRWTDRIIQAVELNFGVTQAAMKSDCRIRHVAYPRFAAMHLIRKYRNYSFPHIGQIFGNRHHTTVMYAMERVKELEATDVDFTQSLKSAEASLINSDTSKIWPIETIERFKAQPLVEAAE